MPTVVTMPKWGLTMTAGTVTNWLAAEGDVINAGTPILTVETEKAVDDIEAPASGVLRKIVAAAGSEVPVMGAVAVIAAPDETISDEELTALIGTAGPAVAASGGAAAPRAKREARPATRDAGGRLNASPAARKLAEQLGVPLDSVTATGPGGRITSADVESAANAQAARAAAPTQREVTLADGRVLSLLVAGPRNANPALVFLHGLGGSLTSWTAVMPAFADRYRVAALDLPGHGGSDKRDPATADYSLTGLAAAIGEAIAAADLAPAVLIGHSLGGAIALRIALDRPKLVRGLILLNSAGLGADVNPALLDRVEAPPSKNETRALLELFFADQRLVLDRGIDDMYRNQTKPGADAALKAAAAAAFTRAGQRIDLRDQLDAVRHPVHLIWGEHDQVFPAHHAQDVSNLLGYAWLDVIAGAGHVPQVEAPAATIALIEEFLRRQPPVATRSATSDAAPAADAAASTGGATDAADAARGAA